VHKWLWRYIREFIPLIIIGIILLSIERIATIIVYGTQMYIVDDVMAESKYGLLPKIIMFFAISQLVWIFSKIISTHVLIHVQVKLENAFCWDLFKSLHRKTIATLEAKRTGEIYTYFSDDVVKRISIAGCA
jgi:ABC-type bacteriocin/lantibiotic exporter with double-glycine peptidase domain